MILNKMIDRRPGGGLVSINLDDGSESGDEWKDEDND